MTRHADRGSILKSVPAMVAGEVVIYGCGVTWLAVGLHVGLAEAITIGFVPLVLGDAIQATLVAGALPGAWKLVGAARPTGVATTATRSAGALSRDMMTDRRRVLGPHEDYPMWAVRRRRRRRRRTASGAPASDGEAGFPPWVEPCTARVPQWSG